MADKIAIRKGQEGSRWWNERPSSHDVAEWFKTVPLHEAMEHDRYINGIVLIPQKAKTDEIVGENPDGTPKIREGVWNMTFTPYPKVETRVQYFHDLMAKNEDWMGVIEVVGGGENGLPPGFSARSVKHGDQGQYETRYLCCTCKVTVYERGDVQWVTINEAGIGRGATSRKVRVGKTIIDSPPATKMVPLLGYNYKPDNFAMMKAETGAVGRALGFAGMLVVPGAGVATADDMNEAEAMEGRPAPTEVAAEPEAKGETAKLPEEPQAETGGDAGEINQVETLRQEANEALLVMKEDFPGAFEEFKTWCKSRGIENLSDLQEVAVLKGIVKKAQKDLDAARQKAKARNGEEPEAPAEESPPEEPAAEEPPAEPSEG